MKAASLRKWARGIRQQTLVVYHAARDPRTPWYVRALAFAVAAYALSPIDLIPDFLPVIGHADDAIITAIVLRSVVRRAGLDAVRRRWPGTDDGFAALRRAAGL